MLYVPRHLPNRLEYKVLRLTQQDFRALTEHAAHVLRTESPGLLDGSDVNPDVSPATLADNIDVNLVKSDNVCGIYGIRPQ